MLKIYVEKSSSVKRKKKIGDHPRWTFHKFSARGHPSPLWSCTKGCPCIVIIHWRFLDPVAAWRLTEERFEFEITIIDYKLSEFIRSRDDSIDKSFHFFILIVLLGKLFEFTGWEILVAIRDWLSDFELSCMKIQLYGNSCCIIIQRVFLF